MGTALGRAGKGQQIQPALPRPNPCCETPLGPSTALHTCHIPHLESSLVGGMLLLPLFITQVDLGVAD